MYAFHLIVGLLSLALGVIGIFLPLLPTTPFLLLSAFCFSRSSKRLHHWLLNHSVFGKYISNYHLLKVIPLRVKVVSLPLMWGSMLYCTIFATEVVWVRIILITIAVGVSWHILSYKSK